MMTNTSTNFNKRKRIDTSMVSFFFILKRRQCANRCEFFLHPTEITNTEHKKPKHDF